MAAHTACEITGIAHEHHLVVGIRSVGRVGKPEVLPHHDAILVASVIKLLVAGHSHPVANHIEVHVAVQAHGNVVFPLAIVEVRLRESPVSAERHDASPVDEKFQLRVRVGISHLPYTCLVVDAGSGVVALLISVSLLVYSGVSCVRIEEPEYVTSRITYVSQVKNNKIFDKQYTFKDKYGKIYTLKMDPITHRKIFKNQQFCKNMRYFVTYDKHSKTIVKIK